jgi:hypothetical protein
MTDLPATAASLNPIAVLRRFARPAKPEERCDLCAAALGEEHEHLLETATGGLQCACNACAVLFGNSDNGRFRRVPRRIETWSDFILSDEQWASLGVPIALAFFFHSTPANGIVSMYPSPYGSTRATLPAEVWDILSRDNPPLARLEPDVEALLVNRIGGRREYFRLPIDQCYRLVGLIRTHWHGISGGSDVWRHMAEFTDALKARSTSGGKNA